MMSVTTELSTGLQQIVEACPHFFDDQWCFNGHYLIHYKGYPLSSSTYYI